MRINGRSSRPAVNFRNLMLLIVGFFVFRRTDSLFADLAQLLIGFPFKVFVYHVFCSAILLVTNLRMSGLGTGLSFVLRN
jgi:hypothetical protein